jgi:hypothetical protein
MQEIEVVLEIMRKQLQDQIARGYGIASFAIHIQDGKIVLIKYNQEVSMKIGS